MPRETYVVMCTAMPNSTRSSAPRSVRSARLLPDHGVASVTRPLGVPVTESRGAVAAPDVAQELSLDAELHQVLRCRATIYHALAGLVVGDLFEQLRIVLGLLAGHLPLRLHVEPSQKA